MPDSDREFIQRATRIGIVLAVATAVVIGLLWVLKSALTPLAAAFVIAYLFDPLIDRFEERRVARSLAIFLLLGLAGIALAAFLIFLVPRMQQEIVALASRLPGYIESGTGTVLPWLEARGILIPTTLQEGLVRLRSGDFPLPLAAIRDVLGQVLSFFTGTVSALVGLLLIPVIAFYFLVEFDHVKTRILSYVPVDYKPYVLEKARIVDSLISGFIRGQLTVCAVLGLLYAIGFSAIGIDLAIVIGLGAGTLAIVPYLGNTLALVAAATMALLQYGVDFHLALVVAWYGLVQLLEGTILTPRIVGKSLGMHPVTVIVALLIGADLLGFLGLLVAVPIAAVIQAFVSELLTSYRASSFYHGSGSTA